MTPERLRALVEAHQADFVDLRYAVAGRGWRHVSLTRAAFEAGCDTGWTSAIAGGGSRVRLRPDGDSATLDPFLQHPTLSIACDRLDPRTGQDDPDDPRGVARRAEAFLKVSGHADGVLVAPVVQFFVFDQASYHQGLRSAAYELDSREGAWRRGRPEGDNLGTQPALGQAADQLPPTDSLHNLRAEMAAALAAMGAPVTRHRRGAATGGQQVLELAPASLTTAADRVLLAKYVARNVAARHGKVATFMPAPLYGESGGALDTAVQWVRGDGPVWRIGDEGELDALAGAAIGGLCTHLRGLLALTCASTNSYRRIRDDFPSPTCAAHAPRHAAAAVRTAERPGGWLTLAAIDPLCDPYLSFAGVVMAMLDGVRQSAAPTLPLPDRVALPHDVPRLPRTLEAALDALGGDHRFLLEGGVFSADLIERYIRRKRDDEIEPLRRRPHPYEFELYFNG